MRSGTLRTIYPNWRIDATRRGAPVSFWFVTVLYALPALVFLGFGVVFTVAALVDAFS